MEFEKVVQSRHSVREFTDQTVSIKDIQHIVTLAQQSPSWVNSQPWKVYVATGQSLATIKNDYLQNDQKDIKAHPDFPVMHRDDWSLATQANMKQWRHEIVHHFSDFDEAHTKMSNASDHLNHTPAILFLTIPKNSSAWSILDLGSFAQTLMLAAKNIGLDSIPNYNSVRFPDVLRNVLAIPDDETIAVGISIGYPKPEAINTFQSKRVPLDDILTFKD